jgi:hypothetical protein
MVADVNTKELVISMETYTVFVEMLIIDNYE